MDIEKIEAFAVKPGDILIVTPKSENYNWEDARQVADVLKAKCLERLGIDDIDVVFVRGFNLSVGRSQP